MVGSIYNVVAFKPYRWNLYQRRHTIYLKDRRYTKPYLVVSVTLWIRVWMIIGNWIFNKFEYYGGVVVVV